jgi:hypothetical protein
MGMTAKLVYLNLEEAFNYAISNASGFTGYILLPAYGKYNGVHSLIANRQGLVHAYYCQGNPNGIDVPWSIPALSMSGVGKYRPRNYHKITTFPANQITLAHLVCVPDSSLFIDNENLHLNIFYCDDTAGTNPSLSPVGKTYVAVNLVSATEGGASGSGLGSAFIPWPHNLPDYTYRKLVDPSPFDALANGEADIPTYVQIRFLDTTNPVTSGTTSATANSNLIGVALYLTNRSAAVDTDFIWQDYDRTGKPNVLAQPGSMKVFHRWMTISVTKQTQ